MTYTHTLEIVTTDVNLIAEVSFENGESGGIKITQPVEMKEAEHAKIDKLIRAIRGFNASCSGDITKIELVKK